MSWFTKKKQLFVCQIKQGATIKGFVAIAACLAVATSCVKDVILDAMEEPTVVMECILSDDPVQTLYLVYTKGASREAAPDLPEATAVLTDLTEGKEAGRFARTADGSWTLAYGALPEHRYRLDVTIPGHDPIWAEQTMPEAPGVAVDWHKWNILPQNAKDTSEDYIGYDFRFTHASDPVWFYGIDYPTADSPGELTQYLYTNSPAVDRYNETEYFRSGEESAWSAPDSDVLRTTCYTVLDGVPKHSKFLRFPPQENVRQEKFLVSGSFKGYIIDVKNFTHAEIRPAELHYLSVSEDYDRFLLDSGYLMEVKASSDLSAIFLRDNVYTNIQGGIGFFGAKIERTLEWEGRDFWQRNGYFLLASFVAGFRADEYFEIDSQFVLTSRPFELLHFECWHTHPGEWAPDWEPVESEWGGLSSRFSLDVIQDQEQMDASGLGDCGEIDFSKKKVLLGAMRLVNEFPILISFGIPGNNGRHGEEWPGGCYPMILLCDIPSHYDNSGTVTAFQMAFRYAILVDKDEPIATGLHLKEQFVAHLSSGFDRTWLAEQLCFVQ